MPGIAGIVTRQPGESARALVQRMVGVMCHERSYRSGIWTDEELGLYIGWTARQGSFAECLPLRNEQGDRTLFFAGENYAAPDHVQRLRQRHAIDGDGASYLVHQAEEDERFPLSLNGRFHGLLVDHARRLLTLFNDRYGSHRLYYHETADAFYFAAEAKAILEARPALRSLDLQSLGEFVSCGCVLHDRTLFRDVRLLPPASAWSFREGALDERRTYFDRGSWESLAPLEAEAYYQAVRQAFADALPRYFGGRERVGMSLTGGLDTRMIMAWQRSAPGALPCYSFGGPFRDCQDVRLARRVAALCGQPHQVIPVGEEFLSNFQHYAQRSVFLTDGCLDVSHSPDLYVNERAARIAPVRMTGNYGGEVMRRVRAFKPVEPAPGLFDGECVQHIAAARDTYAGLLDCHPLSFAVFRQMPWHHHALLTLEQTQVALRSPYLDNDFVRTVFQAPASALTNNDLCLRLIAEGSPELRRLRTDRGLGGDRGRLATALLRGALEFSFKAEYAYDYGMPQWLAKADHLVEPLHLERLFLGRHKFYHFRTWYSGRLARDVREVLLDDRSLSRPYLRRHALETIVHGHTSGVRNFTLELHKLLTLELIHRHFLDQ